MEIVPVWALVCVLGVWLGDVEAHGYLKDPPSRTLPSISYQKNAHLPIGKRIPIDYNYNQLFCGGKSVQWDPAKNNGRCGVCGDNWAEPEPRDHEEGGKYVGDTTPITKTYAAGEVIDVTVRITANHLGYFEFRLCERNSKSKKLNHACLNRHLLQHPTSNRTKFPAGKKTGDIVHRVQLPLGVICQNCVLQWKYITGNDWGWCDDGTGALGCSKTPEEFFACADIAIESGGSGIGSGSHEKPEGSGDSGGSGNGEGSRGSGNGEGSGGSGDGNGSGGAKGSGGSTGGTGGSTSPVCPSGCEGVGLWKIFSMVKWCCLNCNHNPSYCPPSHCSQHCKAP